MDVPSDVIQAPVHLAGHPAVAAESLQLTAAWEAVGRGGEGRGKGGEGGGGKCRGGEGRRGEERRGGEYLLEMTKAE